MVVNASALTSSTRAIRQKKLNLRQQLPVLRERDIEPEAASSFATPEPSTFHDSTLASRAPALVPSDSFAVNSLPKVDTGVELKEEREHHLQAVITASQVAALGGKIAQQIYIPTPDAVDTAELRSQYERLYPARFAQPATYIRFSSTVEDCAGCPYNMSEEDETWLRDVLNKKAREECEELWFEECMNSFEETSALRQPFAAVDNTPVLEYAEMRAAFDDTVQEGARKFAERIYEYWKSVRLVNGNRPLVSKLKTLKMDASAAEADDSDPYVCFRRREVRQVRKTRGRDNQVGEKLKKLRKELEEGRQLLHFVARREMGRKDELALSREIFEKRAAVRDMKRALNIEFGEDDELLITQRSPKKRTVDLAPPASSIRTGSDGRLRLMSLTDSMANAAATAAGSGGDAEAIVLLRERIREREQRVAEKMAEQMAALEAMGERFVDHTEEAILGLYVAPELQDEQEEKEGWVAIRSEVAQMPTPPESDVSDNENENENGDDEGGREHKRRKLLEDFNFRWASDVETPSFRSAPRFRQRRGRGGRLFIDRRFPRDPAAIALAAKRQGSDRWKYDREGGDEVTPELLDPYSTEGFFYREFLRKQDAKSRGGVAVRS